MKQGKAGILISLILMMTLLTATACEKTSGEGTENRPREYFAYYMNLDGDDIGAVSAGKKDPGGKAMLELLYENPRHKKNLTAVLGNTVSLNSASFSDKQALLDFDSSYRKLTRDQEVLFRASVVRSLCQCGDVDFVSFEINGKPIADSKGNLIGAMNDDTFIYNVGNEINAYSRTELTLYFSNEAGNALVPLETEAVYGANISRETLVMQKLIEGPDTEETGLLPTLPADTKLISISVKDGICYLSLDSEAAMSPNNITEEVALYSIVDSLTELPGISKVQISINGEVDRNFRDKLPLNNIYERNTKIVADDQ